MNEFENIWDKLLGVGFTGPCTEPAPA